MYFRIMGVKIEIKDIIIDTLNTLVGYLFRSVVKITNSSSESLEADSGNV